MFSQIMDGVMVVSAHNAYFYLSFLQDLLRVFYTPNTKITGTESDQALCAIGLNQLLRYFVSPLTQTKFISITYISESIKNQKGKPFEMDLPLLKKRYHKFWTNFKTQGLAEIPTTVI